MIPYSCVTVDKNKEINTLHQQYLNFVICISYVKFLLILHNLFCFGLLRGGTG